MTPYRIDSPCSPGDTVFLLCNDGIKQVHVRELLIVKLGDNITPDLCISFWDYPFVVWNDEMRDRFFATKEEAVEALRNFESHNN